MRDIEREKGEGMDEEQRRKVMIMRKNTVLKKAADSKPNLSPQNSG
jgi:hypothetical protein